MAIGIVFQEAESMLAIARVPVHAVWIAGAARSEDTSMRQ
jgi:hypothetical protein